jgi:propionyl-CoA carboxylase alpha chain
MIARRLSRLLVANRGEIASRVFRAARSMGLSTVAVFVDGDTATSHVEDADQAYRIASGSYLDIPAIIDIARRSGADVVHPGYGFLSENAAFAAAVIDAGIAWAGPTPEAIAAMGDKLEAKRLAIKAGVPTLPMAEDLSGADQVGYPLLVKAAAGGGGKGMRVVDAPGALAEAVAAARREAAGAFGDDRVFLERYVSRSRHVEIQILGDDYGSIIHLGERDCSIQRRHQKIIEEAPSGAVDPALREQIGGAAVALAKALRYRSAGTVEFLLDVATREFYFLEVNTRLQVEHPVTEAVTGIDLVAEQLRIAAGEPLRVSQTDVEPTGHAIQARLYAEDPARDFLPAIGPLTAWRPAVSPAVRWDAGVREGSVVGTQFDPMLAKVIAHGTTRAEAAAILALALERTFLAGVQTNRDFLVEVLRSPQFLDDDVTTDFIQRVQPPRSRELSDVTRRIAASAAALWWWIRDRTDSQVLGFMPPAWRNTRVPSDTYVVRCGGELIRVGLRATRDGTICFADGSEARVREWSTATIDLEIDGRQLRADVIADGDRLALHTPDGDIECVREPRFPIAETATAPGALTAPMPGTVIDVRVSPGDQVDAGTVLLILEAMKMEHPVTAPSRGRIAEVRVKVGGQVETDATLVVMEDDDE